MRETERREKMNEVDRVISYIRSCRENNIDVVIVIDKDKSHLVLNALEQSKKYEDTGLTPEQIVEVDKLYADQAKELAEYKKLGFTPDEINLSFNTPDYLWIVEDDEKKEVKQLTVNDEICLRLCGKDTYWDCVDDDCNYYEVPLSGLGEKYFISRNEAKAKLKEMEERP